MLRYDNYTGHYNQQNTVAINLKHHTVMILKHLSAPKQQWYTTKKLEKTTFLQRTGLYK